VSTAAAGNSRPIPAVLSIVIDPFGWLVQAADGWRPVPAVARGDSVSSNPWRRQRVVAHPAAAPLAAAALPVGRCVVRRKGGRAMCMPRNDPCPVVPPAHVPCTPRARNADAAVVDICRIFAFPAAPVMLLLQTSWAYSLLLNRPFSNSLEALWLVVALWLFARWQQVRCMTRGRDACLRTRSARCN